MGCCSQKEPRESSKPNLPHFMGKEIETQGDSTFAQDHTRERHSENQHFHLLTLFPLYHLASELQAEPTMDKVSEITCMTTCTHVTDRSSSEASSPQETYQPLQCSSKIPRCGVMSGHIFYTWISLHLKGKHSLHQHHSPEKAEAQRSWLFTDRVQVEGFQACKLSKMQDVSPAGSW